MHSAHAAIVFVLLTGTPLGLHADVATDATSLPQSRFGAEQLDRGLIALPREDGAVYLSWRMFPSDDDSVRFHVYREPDDGHPPIRVAQTPFTSHLDGPVGDAPPQVGHSYRYHVRVVRNGVETAASQRAQVTAQTVAADGIGLATHLGLDAAPEGVSRHVDRCVPADLNGDGTLDYVVLFGRSRVDPYHWKPSPDTLKLQAIDGHSGQVMWTFDFGKGTEMGVWYSPFVVYDLDGDGVAEVVTKTNAAPQFVEAQGPGGGPKGMRVEGGPEFITILDGRTGTERARAPWPSREGFETYNHLSRNLLAVAYLDGRRPYLLVNRGTYALAKWEAWRFDGQTLKRQWQWSTNDPGMQRYEGSGAHMTLVADIDGDGMDEFFWGCVCLDGDGDTARVKWAVGLPGDEERYTIGHVDIVALGDIRPDLPGPEVYFTIEHHPIAGVSAWGVEDPRKGALYVEADGTPHWIYTPAKHVHGGWTADVVGGPDAPGWECYYFEGDGSLYRLARADGSTLNEGLVLPGTIEWDGDELLELVDNQGNIFDHGDAPQDALPDKASIVCVADLVGDFREEFVIRQPDGTLKILTTTQPVRIRRPSRLFERTYRLWTASYGSGYTGWPMRGGETWNWHVDHSE